MKILRWSYFIYTTVLVIVSIVSDLSNGTLILIALLGLSGILLEILYETAERRKEERELLKEIVEELRKKEG